MVPAAEGGFAPWQDPRVQRRLLGILFVGLAVGLALIAVFSALQGGRAWVIAVAAAVLAIWMGDQALRALVRQGTRPGGRAP
jgi:hypothetical protein